MPKHIWSKNQLHMIRPLLLLGLITNIEWPNMHIFIVQVHMRFLLQVHMAFKKYSYIPVLRNTYIEFRMQ